MATPDQLRQILETVRTIALVGASEKPHRDSHTVMAFLQGRGYRVIPVNPRLAGGTLLGERVYPNITSIPDKIDMVDLFLASHRVGAVVDEALRRSDAGVIWMQIGVIDEDAAARAESAGRQVVMDRCPKQEIPRLGVPLATN
ncbi:CoA-binding protein [Marinobacter halodurans]|uniref:CoA-binding protein n=1 Tax=Marinobacter halodurans TaxID=2528979 RepID=A0ABY1ZJJ1_9GAMM|nr:CoA-binding protein [Marinobacter halodurans]TBW54882.1 CoA-binding protein [Marinobacter halodurans]